MLEMWGHAGDTFLSGLSRVSLITLYKILGHEFWEMLGYPKRGGLFLKWGWGGLNPTANYGTSLADIFRCQFTLPTGTVLLITDTPNIKPCKTFLVRNLSILDKVLQFAISSPWSPLWLTHFSVGKTSKVPWGRDRNMDTIIEISISRGQPPLLYSEN